MDRLKDLREDKELLQKDIATILGISQRGYSHYENGDNKIPNEILKRLAIFYDVSTDYILGLTNDKRHYRKKDQ